MSLKDISTELSESKETIKILQESNDALELRNTNLKNENSILKEKNKRLPRFFVKKENCKANRINKSIDEDNIQHHWLKDHHHYR